MPAAHIGYKLITSLAHDVYIHLAISEKIELETDC